MTVLDKGEIMRFELCRCMIECTATERRIVLPTHRERKKADNLPQSSSAGLDAPLPAAAPPVAAPPGAGKAALPILLAT